MKTTKIRGLKDRLREAESVSEVDELMTEGDGYRYADPVTRLKWTREAKKRKAELKGEE